MICPNCNGKTAVVDNSHDSSNNVDYRKRKCKSCNYIFYTIEEKVEYDEYVKEVYNRYNRNNYRAKCIAKFNKEKEKK